MDLWLKLVENLYKTVLRDILKKAVDDPNTEWDDTLILMCDRLFGWKPS